MTHGLYGRLNSALERAFPEQRLFLKSSSKTRFVRLRPVTQAVTLTGGAAILGWSIFASAILIMDTIGAGNLREQTDREQAAYEGRLNDLATERDARAEDALRAQQRFSTALAQVSAMQEALLSSEERRKELETGIGAVQATLRDAMTDRDAALAVAEMLTRQVDQVAEASGQSPERLEEAEDTLDVLAEALTRTATERDTLAGLAAEQKSMVEDLILEAQLDAERNDRIFSNLEEAVTVSLEPLDKMFRAVGLDPDTLIEQVRRGYGASEGLGRLSLSTKGNAGPEAARANAIIGQLDEMNLYRVATEKMPFAKPLKSSYRFTSGFGPRWGRMHKGSDFASRHGTPIYATADGVVSFAGQQSGYGNVVKVKHAFGIESTYAHNSKLRVDVGQRVSRGDHIADMGNTGRSTGTHLHYEVKVNGKAVDPMTYIKAAKDVF